MVLPENGLLNPHFQAELQATSLPESRFQASHSGNIPCLNIEENQAGVQAATSQIRQVIQAKAR